MRKGNRHFEEMKRKISETRQHRILCIYVSKEDMKIVQRAEELVLKGEFKSLSQLVVAGLDVMLGSMQRRRAG